MTLRGRNPQLRFGK
jgi:hypothetical protein